jgi:dihydroceramide fatty acyl 2-hydroxylase
VSAEGITDECLEASRQAWAPRPGPAGERRIPLFTAFVPERLIFRGHPVLPHVVGLPFIGWCLWRHASAPAHGAWASAGLFALGVLLWTLVEYLMHRFLFHWPAEGPVGRVVTFVVHGHHHVTPRERSRLAATPVQFGSLGLLLAGFWQLVFDSPTWALAMAGTATGYLLYEAIHYLAHHGRPKSRLLKALVRHHLAHHYRTPDRRWGISSPLWDWVFRTAR